MNIVLRSKPELIRAYPSIKDQCSRVRNIKVMNFFYKCQHLNSPTTPTLRVKVWQLSEWLFSPCRCVQTMFGWWPIPNVEPHGLRWSQSSTNCAIVLTKSQQGLTYQFGNNTKAPFAISTIALQINQISIFIGPESDHWECLSVTN